MGYIGVGRQDGIFLSIFWISEQYSCQMPTSLFITRFFYSGNFSPSLSHQHQSTECIAVNVLKTIFLALVKLKNSIDTDVCKIICYFCLLASLVFRWI